MVAAGHKPLSGPEITAMLTGNTQYLIFLTNYGSGKTGDQAALFYRNARDRTILIGDKSRTKVETIWWIEGNFICSEQKVVKTGHSCASMYRVDSAVYSCIQPAGECVYMSRIVPGNPDNL